MRDLKYTLFVLTLMAFLMTGMFLYYPVSLRQLTTVEGLVSYARSFGPIMPLAVFFVTVVQAIVPVIPFIILCSANSLLFGITEGTLLTWAATLVGASVTFYTARSMGYDWASRKYNKINTEMIDNLNGYKGFLMILSLRLLPYVPAPLINVSAGVSGIRFFWFLLASAIGKLPFIIGYGMLGYSLTQSKNYTVGLALMAGLILVPYLIARYRKKRMI